MRPKAHYPLIEQDELNMSDRVAPIVEKFMQDFVKTEYKNKANVERYTELRWECYKNGDLLFIIDVEKSIGSFGFPKGSFFHHIDFEGKKDNDLISKDKKCALAQLLTSATGLPVVLRNFSQDQGFVLIFEK
jgi:hypothetical protein